MRKRFWAASWVGFLCLVSCSSDKCDDGGCLACERAPDSSGCASGSGDETSSGASASGDETTTEQASTSAATDDSAESQTSDDTRDEPSSNETTDPSDVNDDSDTQPASTGASDETSNSSDDTDATTDSDDSDTSVDSADAASSSQESETSDGFTSDQGGGETSEAPVGPEDPTSDASTRLKTVPIGTSDAELGYWEYLPPEYDAAPSPLLVFTHGASWQGDGSDEQLQELLTVGPVNLISEDKWPNSRPFIVLAPQNPHSGCFTAEDIDGFYHYALDTYNVDTTRIYHTGQSCGAIGGWNYLAAHLDEFVTAAVLISGDGQDAFAQAGCDLGRVAIWGLHNEKDGTVNSAGTINPIMDLMMCDPVPDVKLTIYPDATEHDAWTKTYDLSAGNDIYSWLLQHTHQ